MKCKTLMKVLVLSAFTIVNTTLINASDNVLLAEMNMVEQASSLATMEIIDLKTLEEPMIIGAGSGPMAAYEWSINKNKCFEISSNQQVEIQLMYVEAFTPNTDSKNIILTFVGDNGEVVTEKIIDTDTTKTISFKEAGIYKLSIYNNQNFSINYGFKLK